MLIFGAILFVFGLLLCMTVIGAIIGIPLIFIGGIFMTIGMFTRRRTVITNVVQVAMPQPMPVFVQPVANFVPAPAQLTSVPVPPVSASAILNSPTKSCRACNAGNGVDNRFCTECGAALNAAS